MIDRRRVLLAGGAAALVSAGLPMQRAAAAGELRVASVKFGSLSWLLETIRAEGLAEKAGVNVIVVDVATNQAGPVALLSGEADVIVSDWPWAMRQRALGEQVKFAPYSSALGAVMVAHEFAHSKAGRSQGQDARRRRRCHRQELAAAARLFEEGARHATSRSWRCPRTAPLR